jgi:hypothetical protein
MTVENSNEKSEAEVSAEPLGYLSGYDLILRIIEAGG